MPKRIEFHILQSFAPANLNRDDTGAPKDTIFGGSRRGRISSQALKRAARMYMQDSQLIPPHARSYRTNRVVDLLTRSLVKRGIEEEIARAVATAGIESIGSQKKMKVKDNKTEYLMFFGQEELDQLTQLLATVAEETSSKKVKLDKELSKSLTEVLTKKNKAAVDVALFGRMLANLPEGNTDASCQVAHAISTHRVERDFDYFTAVDDLKPDDTAGAGMIGTIEFNSSCYYRFSVIDCAQLAGNLGDAELTRQAIRGYSEAVVNAIPTGKQNTFAAHNPPSTVLAVVRHAQAPRNLANAFESPVAAGADGFQKESARRLGDYWTKLDDVYGSAEHAWYLDISDGFPPETRATRVGSLNELIEAVLGVVG